MIYLPGKKMSSTLIERLNKYYRGSPSENKEIGESSQRYAFRKKLRERLSEKYENIKLRTAIILSKQIADRFFLNLEYEKKIETEIEILMTDLFL